MRLIFSNKFYKKFDKLDKTYQVKVEKQITKIIRNPKIGKPMKNGRKGTREVYVSPFRLAYKYFKNENIIEILAIYHRSTIKLN